eukprot:CAMPEP_0183716244 /NCGR_PEP_ID=MMETSP0737-20130205/10230_1 /TAXON_ID=385413 /ORGANISM="Thalassiosira miniscula, Strain CCMP1093" /LENGTH=73 /DNA_ID=CAMNT_0025945481 /DNA_START=1 /DNA_END=219 /DNA_ORIENTATION=+
MPRVTFREQVGGDRSSQVLTDMDKMKLAAEVDLVMDGIVEPFESKFAPSEMRQLALVAHNHMKPAMKEFIETY